MGWSRREKYRTLLLSLALLFVGYPAAQLSTAARVAYDVLLTVVVFGVILPLFPTTRLRLLAATVGIPMVVVNWTRYIRSDPALETGFHALSALYLGFMAVMIVIEVSRQQRVTVDSVYGALCGYVLIGVAFGHVFCVVESVAPGSYAAAGTLAEELHDNDRNRFLLIYFSFTTLTTLGYGDIIPATDVTRSLGAAEAILGQFYVAVLIADFVGKRIAQAATESLPRH